MRTSPCTISAVANRARTGSVICTAPMFLSPRKTFRRVPTGGITRELKSITTNRNSGLTETTLAGAGPNCDGQVLVIDDILGMYPKIKPKFVKQYANIRPAILDAVSSYCKEVKEKKFPTQDYSY